MWISPSPVESNIISGVPDHSIIAASIDWIPALYKIVDEILVNAADNR